MSSTIEHFIDSNNLVNKEFFDSVKELLTCAICTGIIIDPKQCQTCENSFCNKCLTKWQLKSKCCPYKCSTLVIKDCTRAIRNLLDKLVLTCPFECELGIQYTYDGLIKHIKACKKVQCKCPTCGTIVAEGDIKENLELIKLKEELKALQEVNRKLTQEKTELAEKVKQITKKLNTSGTSPSTESELGLKDKCEHFKGNYIPLFACCNKAYPCYICHDLESRSHSYEFSNRVICLNCNNIYTGIQCSQCNTFQIYRKK
jgi:hypothetical protein